MFKWKEENDQVFNGKQRIYEEEEKRSVGVVWKSDILKKQEETALSCYFTDVYLRLG